MIVTATEMKQCDQYTIEQVGIPSLVLMERAALAVFTELTSGTYDLTATLVVCGSGNNGGDGFAIARLLQLAGFPVTILFCGKTAHQTPETQQQANICDYYKIPLITELPDNPAFSLIVDSYLGIGAKGQLTEEAEKIITDLNNLNLPIVAVDVPSGIDATTGESLGTYIQAQTTVTFQFAKSGFFQVAGQKAVGKLIIADVGISGDALTANFSVDS